MRGCVLNKVRLIVEYNGAQFHGWQFQPGLRTVQGELQRALEVVLRQPVTSMLASGRTDAGVHAKGQVVAFTVEVVPDLEVIIRGVSHILKGELSVLSAEEVPLEFHPTRDAIKKQYTYTILNRQAPAVLDRGFVWHVPRAIDVGRMQHAAQQLVGTHDFSSFRTSGCCARSPVKTVYESEICMHGSYVHYRVVGSGFLKQMVRSIVGTLVHIGRGECGEMEAILAAKSRMAAGPTAPAAGLCLDRVWYPEDGSRRSQT